ncbi:MAG: DEAD/DEAH box helicase family protein [Candidatus Chryseobacterium colombiense]|nr:DEAD/DEAH box helicase family protein [Chryseobacterium sp.]WEK69631.1 MAG: DEAD/DEAH box helicase family protein [Chryseobacterium sp.]
MQQIQVEPFNNIPINFKEINASDFDGFIVEGNGKTVIKPTNGYISNSLLDNIDLYKSDTTIINASVGQGKTTAVIKFVERYYKNQNYIVVIATPFKSLIEQYESKIKKESGFDNIIFNYQDFENGLVNKQNFKSLHQKPIQLITINSLLGNSGDIALKQSDIKREYFESLINYAKDNGKKVILILDEIHESIHNFKESLIFNLFKWNSVIHKNIVLSATFNEASKVVIKYLAELTDKKIKIIESARQQVEEEKLSDLHLCIYDSYQYQANSPIFESLFIDEGKNFDKIHILSYSKRLAEDIHKSQLGKKLEDTFGEFNLCTSKNNKPFDEKICNIGTVFKTGISIEDKNCAYFIILPPKSAYSDIKNRRQLGIFFEGIFNVVQAVARPRIKANIYIIMPSPDKLIKVPELPENYIKATSLDYLPFDDENNHAKYYNINSQDSLLRFFYANLRENQESGEKFVDSNNISIVPVFPNYEKYKLTDGEKFYRSYYEIFGKNLSDYVYWAAWNNQFVNCRLKSIIKTSSLFISEGYVQNTLDKYYKSVFSASAFFNMHSDKDSLMKFRSSLFSNNIYFKSSDKDDYNFIGQYRNSYFEKQVISFIQRYKRPFNFDIKKIVYKPDGFEYIIENNRWKKKTPNDVDISKETYLRLAMLYSNEIDTIPQNLKDEEKNLISNYKRLFAYREILLKEYVILSKRRVEHLPIDKDINFKTEHQIELLTIIENIKKFDKNIQAFSFLQKSKDLVPIYKLLKDLFFKKTTITRISTDSDPEPIKVLKFELFDFPKKEEYINLVYSIDNAWLLQSGNIQWGQEDVIDEYSNDPFYGKY